MSLPRKMTVKCSKCGHPLVATVFESLNSDYAKNVAMQIIGGELFDVKCPHCQFVSHLEYDILYHDLNHGAMIWVVHTDSPDYASKISDIRAAQKLPYKTLRIVEDMNALKEKVSCLERNRDDRIIEMCKIFILGNLLAQKPNFAFKEAFYSVLSGEELIYFYDVDGKSLLCKLQDETYDYLSGLYFNSKYANEFDPNYAIVDSNWADEIVGVLLQAEIDRIQGASVEKNNDTANSKKIVEGTICPECRKNIPEDSRFCQHCGFEINPIKVKVQPRNQQVGVAQKEKIVLSAPKPSANRKNGAQPNPEFAPEKRKKTKWIVVSVIAVVVAALLCYGGFVSHNYSCFEDALENQEFINAKRYFDVIPFGEKILSEDYTYMNAGILLEEGKYIEAYGAFTTNQSRPVPEAIISGLKDKLYSLGQSAYRSAKYEEAREYFNIIAEYKRSSDYLLLLDCSDPATVEKLSTAQYKSLLKLLDAKFENADEIILETDSLLTRFLTARWEDGKNHSTWVVDDEEAEYWWRGGHSEDIGPYYFELRQNGGSSFLLPNNYTSGSCEISDGHYWVKNGSSMVKCFGFEIIDQDTISVYCYKDNSTHTLYRK